MGILTDVLPSKEEFNRAIKDVLSGKGGALLYLALLGLFLGLISVGRVFILGHGETVNTTAQIPWGAQIFTYIYLVLISAGCIFTHFFGVHFCPKSYIPIAPKVIFFGIVAALGGMFGLATELGHVERLYLWFLSPQPKSPMWWMAVWYTLDLSALFYAFYEIKKGHISKSHAWIDFLIAIMLYGTLGALLGAVEQRFFYYSALNPLNFIVSGFITGVAAASIIAATEAPKMGEDGIRLMEFFRKMLLIGLGIGLFITFWRGAIGLYGQINGSEIFELTLPNQIIFGLLLSGIIPMALLFYFKSRNALILISLLIMISQLKMRYDFVVGGFTIPVWRAYTIPKYINYVPSIDEVLIFIGGLSLAIFLYSLANKMNMLTFKGTEH